MHWFILHLLRTHHLGWKIRRPSRLTNLLNLSKVWATHICNSLSLNKKGNTIPEVPKTPSLLCWWAQGLTSNQAGGCRANCMQTKNLISKPAVPNWKILPPPQEKHAKSQDCPAVSWPQKVKKLCAADSLQSLGQSALVRKGCQFTWLWISQNSAQENDTEVEEARQSERPLGIVKSYTCQWLQKLLEGTFELGLNSSSEHKLIPQPCIKHQSAINQKVNKIQVNFPDVAFPPCPPPFL